MGFVALFSSSVAITVGVLTPVPCCFLQICRNFREHTHTRNIYRITRALKFVRFFLHLSHEFRRIDTF